MHIPDGILKPELVVGLGTITVIGIAVAAKRARETLEDENISLVGLLGAFVFALQMLNFPIAGGVSDHIVGAGLLAIIFGPSIAILCMAAILIIQAFVFADGGLAALSANIFNMGLISSLSAYYLYRLLARKLPNASIVIATFIAVMLASAAAAFELMLSHPYKGAFLAAMLSTHVVSGIAEAAVTLVVVRSLVAQSSAVAHRLAPAPAMSTRSKAFLAFAVITIVAAGFLSWFAYSAPDALEHSMEEHGPEIALAASDTPVEDAA